MITVSPLAYSESLSISRSTSSTIASVLSTCSTTNASTPQVSASWLRVAASVVKASTGAGTR